MVNIMISFYNFLKISYSLIAIQIAILVACIIYQDFNDFVMYFIFCTASLNTIFMCFVIGKEHQKNRKLHCNVIWIVNVIIIFVSQLFMK
jgi:hypothetical protein